MTRAWESARDGGVVREAAVSFRVSVVIPVFNAAKYLRDAVESVVRLEEVEEIVLVEDGSSDDSYDVCRALQNKYKQVTVYTHPHRKNMGISATRNLGIEKSSSDYLAFLDADDWYLPNRFACAKTKFAENPTIDGVYNATGYFVEGQNAPDPGRLTTVYTAVEPRELLFTLLRKGGGHFHTSGITIRRSILKEAGLFDPSLRVHEDGHLWWRLAHVGTLVAGDLREPVAIRRVHSSNISREAIRGSRKLLHAKALQWFRTQDKVDPRAYRILVYRNAASSTSNRISRAGYLAWYFLKRPKELRKLF